MDLPETVVTDLKARLRRIEGQVRGLERMLDEGRECREIVTQVAAANHALEQVGFRLVTAGIKYCLVDPEAASAEGYRLDEVEKLFLRLT